MSDILVRLTERQAFALLEAATLGLDDWAYDQQGRPEDTFGNMRLRSAQQARLRLIRKLPKEEA